MRGESYLCKLGVSGTWNALENTWLQTSGHRMEHPSYEVYVNNPMSTPKDALVIEICLRISS